MALVAFRGAEAGDTLDLRLEIEGPDGQRAEGIPPTPLYVAPGEEGANAVINLTLRIRQEGIYLMHVLLGEREFTRVPLRVEVQEQRPPPEQSELTQ
jgi:hypothetical protein